MPFLSFEILSIALSRLTMKRYLISDRAICIHFCGDILIQLFSVSSLKSRIETNVQINQLTIFANELNKLRRKH